MIRNIRNKKYFDRVILLVIMTTILFVFGIIVLRYHVEGETNMPFQLSKISVISSSEGIDKEATDSKWAFDVCQSNDVFLYIEKNSGYGKTELIQSVRIDNIQMESSQKDKIKIYKPDEEDEKSIFKNKEENQVETIEYKGSIESNLKQLDISNQGGLVAFRCSIDNLVEYKSNDEVITHQELLKKAGVTKENLEIKMIFDLIIKLESGKEFQTTIHLDFPIGNVIDDGVVSKEITEVNDFIFKRI